MTMILGTYSGDRVVVVVFLLVNAELDQGLDMREFTYQETNGYMRTALRLPLLMGLSRVFRSIM